METLIFNIDGLLNNIFIFLLRCYINSGVKSICNYIPNRGIGKDIILLIFIKFHLVFNFHYEMFVLTT